MNPIFSSFTKLNELSKTLCFELKPIGKTLEKIKDSGIWEHDKERAEIYPEIKRILDTAHKKLLQESLSNINNEEIDWNELEQAYLNFRNSNKDNNARKELKKILAKFRKIIVECFKKHPDYDLLTEATPAKFIEKQMETDNNPNIETLKKYKGYATILSGFQKNRKNIYSDKEQSTAAANRSINDNFPKFMVCVKIFRHMTEIYPLIIEEAEIELSDLLSGQKLKEIFEISSYSKFLSQNGIDFLNNLIGGYCSQEKKKIKGINEFINLYKQKNEIARADKSLGIMPHLYKQILFDHDSISFLEKPFETDEDVVSAINLFSDKFWKDNILEKTQHILSKLTLIDDIYINSSSLSEISLVLFGEWNKIRNALEEYAENKFSDLTTQKKRDKAISEFVSKPEYSVIELSNAKINEQSVNVLNFWSLERQKEKMQSVSRSFAKYKTALEKTDLTKERLQEHPDIVDEIKAFLDSIQEVLHYISPLNAGEKLERNSDFYGDFDEIFDRWETIIPLYNKVRNYVTKKPSEIKKIPLKFDCPTLADGWDENKENSNLSVILKKDNLFYLAIIKPKQKNKPNFKNLSAKPQDCTYQKMIYKLLPDPSKMLPKVFLKSETGQKNYSPSEELLKRYDRGDHKKNEPTFDINFCYKLIDFFKQSIEKHPDWKYFDFKFKNTSMYTDINEFYNEISEQGYKVSFVDIPASDIDDLVEKGNIFLFQIYNKDFSKYSKGNENLHTMYWKGLFCEENLKTCILRLNGKAQLFYRPQIIKNAYTHKMGEKMLNRRDRNGNSIPKAIFSELFEYINNPKTLLSDEAKMYLDKIIIKPVKHDIVKNKRFTEDKFLFHVPFSINKTANTKNFNYEVNKCLIANKNSLRYIGVDRGERNLIYLCMIDEKGAILLQKSFNIIDTVNQQGTIIRTDYHKKLDDREQERDLARKNWKEIDNIKDLKAGYLSQVVHEISKLIIENNAVVILEDLNFGFKRERTRIEKQVYQKFEKALIDKLNYLFFKNNVMEEPGGLLKGYQLTNTFKSFETLGKQTGILFYVPAAYTSKIDPTTGFTNLFNLKSCSTGKGIKEFFEKFDSIIYDNYREAFAFKFNYKNFKTSHSGFKNDWTVYTAKRRLIYDKKTRSEKEINPTLIIKNELQKAGVTLSDNYDLKGFMKELEPIKFASFFKTIFYAFERTLQMRNSSSSKKEDYIESPVLNKEGTFFDTRTKIPSLPQDADANGAFHIALKGLCVISEMDENNSKDLSNTSWLEFAQKRCT